MRCELTNDQKLLLFYSEVFLNSRCIFKVVFSYEEALGYCVGGIVRDKDGISGSIAFTEMTNELFLTRGLTLKAYLDSLYAQYGQFQSCNSYVICHDPVVIAAVFARLRSCGTNPAFNGYFDKCGEVSVSSIRDITSGVDINVPAGTGALPSTPDSQMIMFAFENGCTVTLRTSGTEPKVKYYIEMGGRPGQSRSEVAAHLASFSTEVVQQLLRPDLHKFA